MGMSCDIFDAVRGHDNGFAAWFYRSILKQTARVPPGLMGCYLSHAMIWAQTILDERIGADEFVLVMEDDLVWHPDATNDAIEALLARVPGDASMVKFSVCDFVGEVRVLEERGQVQPVAGGVYLQTGMLGGYLMYAVRKAVLPALLEFVYPGHFDNALAPRTYVLLPYPAGISNTHTGNVHFGVCYQGDAVSDIAG